MKKDFIHIGMQINFPIEELEEHLKLLEIKPFINFNKNKSGLYLMSINQLSGIKYISDFTDEEIKNEYERREL